MSDVHTDEDPQPRFDPYTGEPLDAPEPESKGVRDLRAAAKKGAAAEARAESLARENAFLKAGIDTETPTGKLLFKAYEGDLADLAALKAEAEAVGALRPATPEAPAEQNPQDARLQPAATRDEVVAMAARGQVASGAPPSQGVTGGIDPYREAYQGFERDVASGRSAEDAMAIAFNKVLTRYDEGDPRTFYEQTPARDANLDRIR